MGEAESVSARKATLLNPTEDDETVRQELTTRLGRWDVRAGDPRRRGGRGAALVSAQEIDRRQHHGLPPYAAYVARGAAA